MTASPTAIDATVKLANNVEMPWLGLGVWQAAEGKQAADAVRTALEAGYRAIDTASAYRNEASVGKGLRDSKLPRQDVFVTTKLWNEDQRQGRARDAMRESLDRLKLDYVDLYLIHWPVADKFVDTWHALEELYHEGLARAIGVSNFMRPHLDALLPETDFPPVVNQIEFHPRLVQPDLIQFCLDNDIRPTAWSPLMQGEVVKIPELVAIGEKHGKTAAQVALRWEMQRGVLVIPKSVTKSRIIENGDIFDFELSADEVTAINALDENRRVGPDPLNFNF